MVLGMQPGTTLLASHWLGNLRRSCAKWRCCTHSIDAFPAADDVERAPRRVPAGTMDTRKVKRTNTGSDSWHIAVLIPARDEEDLLPRCLESAGCCPCHAAGRSDVGLRHDFGLLDGSDGGTCASHAGCRRHSPSYKCWTGRFCAGACGARGSSP